MKTLNAMIAVLFFVILGASSCTTRSAAVEQEEEITQGTNYDWVNSDNRQRGIWAEHQRDRGYSD